MAAEVHPIGDGDKSVYKLITELCENQIKCNKKSVTQNTVKHLRKKMYNILLFRKEHANDTFWLENCSDYHSQFLGWRYILSKSYHQQEMAENLEIYVQKILHSKYDELFRDSIFHFLLKLKKPPCSLKDSGDAQQPHSKTSLYHKFDQSDFHLPGSTIVSCTTPSTSSKFFCPDEDTTFGFKPEASRSHSDSSYYECTTAIHSGESEGIRSQETARVEINWETMSLMKFSEKRTWESLGNTMGTVEKVFLSEVETKVYDILHIINDLKMHQLDNDCDCARNTRVLSREEYMNDIKSLVVGIQSTTFIEIEDNFIINDLVLFEGISSQLFKQYATLFINAGVCYKDLFAIVTDFGASESISQHGFVYNEFCSAVNRYLAFHRAAALHFSSTKGIIQFHAHIRKISSQLFMVASVCKVGIYKDPNFKTDELNSIEVLNLLYNKMLTQSDRQMLLVLHALLYPCLQVYFMKYLHPWIMEGTIYDPNEEFFIRTDTKYLQSRGRTYWTRSFYICEEAVPVFCVDHAKRILECGQNTNLINLCTLKDKPIQKYSNQSKECLLQCCITDKQLRRLQMKLEKYELDVIAKNGAPFNLKQVMQMKTDEELVYNQFQATRKACSIKRFQLEKLDKISKENAFKRSSLSCIFICNERKEEEEVLNSLTKGESLCKEEALNVINYYENIAESASKLNKALSIHNESFKKLSDDISEANLCLNMSKTSMSIPINSFEPVKTRRRVISNIHLSPQKQKEYNKSKILAIEFGPETSFTLHSKDKKDIGSSSNSLNATIPEVDVLMPEQTYNNANSLLNNSNNGSSESILLKSQPNITYINSNPMFELMKIHPNDVTSKTNLFKLNVRPSSLRIPIEDIKHLHMHLVRDIISQSIIVPTRVQLALVKSQLLKHFVIERQYINHLENLRNFYFLLDGGFAGVLTHNLFNKFIDLIEADEVFCQHVLDTIMEEALMAAKISVKKQHVKLVFTNVPKILNLTDVYCLDCVSLQYEIKWPMNVLFPTKIMRRYEEIFKFMVKVQRVSWVVKCIFMELKIIGKQNRSYARYLYLSEHYKKIHQWRYIMNHFVQNLQNYIAGEILQNSWTSLYKTLEEIEDFDELYYAHSTYLKQVQFLCLLNQRTSPIRDIILNIFGIYLKFYNYLCGREWRFNIGYFHPNFTKMEYIYNNFIALTTYFVKICKRIGRVAYQPQFSQLIDILNLNEHYTKCSTILCKV